MFGLIAICGLTAALPPEHAVPEGVADAVLIAVAQRGNIKAFGTLHAALLQAYLSPGVSQN